MRESYGATLPGAIAQAYYPAMNTPTVCPVTRCSGRFPCRKGATPVAGHPRWKRRRRVCDSCGHAEIFFEIPAEELQALSRAATALTDAVRTLEDAVLPA
jgi:hypothetical protein